MHKSFLNAAAVFLLAMTTCAAADDPMLKFSQGIPGDQAVEAASKLNIKIPVMCREWHIWWSSPHGEYPRNLQWGAWKGQQMYGVYNPDTTIEQTVKGSSWRRYLNSAGYPLIGPYGSAQPDIIRWQLETARNAGIECLHVHLWPSIWDAGEEFTPLPIFDKVLEIAAELNYPVAFHDEIQFREPKIGKAQTLQSSIARTTMFLKRYGQHPGLYKIDGMPVYYFQNWSKWISAKDMENYFAAVEKECGPVYWMVEMADIEDYVKVPQLKVFLSHNNIWIKEGHETRSWSNLLPMQKKAAELARKYGKKVGVLVFTRFNNNYDRGTPGTGYKPAKDGMSFIEALSNAQSLEPDFIVLTQWNDYQEGAFIEPAWDYEDFNGDPFRYCRMVSASLGKKFTPAALPKRSELDPYIRHKLFGDSQAGDMGPVFQNPLLEGDNLKVDWTDGVKAIEMRFVQSELARWQPSDVKFMSQKLRLANGSVIDENGVLKAASELRFYAPGLSSEKISNFWIGIRCKVPEKTFLSVEYHSSSEYYRTDSRWEMRKIQFKNGFKTVDSDGWTTYWSPVYDAMFNGKEGDILIRTTGDKNTIEIKEIVLWSPDMRGVAVSPVSGDQIPLPAGLKRNESFVVVAYDSYGNPGQPRLMK